MDFETWFKQHVPNAPAGKYHELLDVWDAATKAERERCAKLCEEIARERVPLAAALGADDCATAILRSAS